MGSEFSNDSDYSSSPESHTDMADAVAVQSGDAASATHTASLDEVLKGLDMAVTEALETSTSAPPDSGTGRPAPSQDQTAHDDGSDGDDEISIEKYMQQLLERTRGASAPDSPRDGAAASSSRAGVPAAAPASGKSDDRSDNTDLANLSSSPNAAEASRVPSTPVRPPERRETLHDLRDVANVTAHQAINSCSCKKLATRSRDTLLTAMIVQVVSFALVATAPPARSLAYFAAVVAFIISSFWTLRFAAMTRQLKQLVVEMQIENEEVETPGDEQPCTS